MKRRDWRIKNLKRGIFGNKKVKRRFYYKWKNISFLRKLFLKKNIFLFRKNLISNYFFYKKIINHFKYLKNKHINNFIVNNKKSLLVYPNFFLKKKIVSDENLFKSFLRENSLNFVLLMKKYNDNFSEKNGVNLILFSKMNTNDKNFIYKLVDSTKKEKEDNFVLIKYNNILDDFIDFNFFFNYNLFNNNLVEIYKILIMLNINIIVKK